MRMLSQSEFNAEVMRALEKNSQEWLTLINRRVLRFVWGLKRGNADVRDSPAVPRPTQWEIVVPDVLLHQGIRVH